MLWRKASGWGGWRVVEASILGKLVREVLPEGHLSRQTWWRKAGATREVEEYSRQCQQQGVDWECDGSDAGTAGRSVRPDERKWGERSRREVQRVPKARLCLKANFWVLDAFFKARLIHFLEIRYSSFLKYILIYMKQWFLKITSSSQLLLSPIPLLVNWQKWHQQNTSFLSTHTKKWLLDFRLPTVSAKMSKQPPSLFFSHAEEHNATF